MTASTDSRLHAALNDLRERLGGPEQLLIDGLTPYRSDHTEHAGLVAIPDAVALPRNTEDVRVTVEWACEHRIPLVPRGGGTGLSGGAVAVDGGVVVDLSRMNQVLRFEPELWRVQLQAGVRTGTLHRLARENGVRFPPDPGASETSQIGGNIATNAGGPHAFKYGVTSQWVTGIEAVIPPGEVITLGGAVRKDVTAYDLKHLLIGSEGTLGIITSAWLRLIPAPELELPVVGAYRSIGAGCEAIARLFTAGCVPAAIDYLDPGALAASRSTFPAKLSEDAAFLVVAEADGSELEARAAAIELKEALVPEASDVWAPTELRDVRALWRWREGMPHAVAAQHGGKMSGDIAVPVDRLAEAIERTRAIGDSHGLAACSWGHAGDGNLHSTFMVDAGDVIQLERARAAVQELHGLAIELRGSISGEHGIGWLKRAGLPLQLGARELELHRKVKELFDPLGVMNPGKKI
jgi:glycolate oxidase subunit GlcD